MDLIIQEDIFTRYTEVMKCKKRYSNCYFSVHEFRARWEEDKLIAYQKETAFLIIEKQKDFNYLYYICDSWDWLQEIGEIKKEFPKLVVSIVQRKENELQKPFLEHGYSVYKTYQRLRKTEKTGESEKGIVADYCVAKDKDRLKKMMQGTFDVLSDHIPSDKELDAFLEEKKIICVRENDIVIGFIIFEDKGKTSYIRMVCIDHACRGKGIGSKLMHTYFQIHGGYKSFTLWYDINNSPAYSLYRKWGYEEEDMYNLIFVL